MNLFLLAILIPVFFGGLGDPTDDLRRAFPDAYIYTVDQIIVGSKISTVQRVMEETVKESKSWWDCDDYSEAFRKKMSDSGESAGIIAWSNNMHIHEANIVYINNSWLIVDVKKKNIYPMENLKRVYLIRI